MKNLNLLLYLFILLYQVSCISETKTVSSVFERENPITTIAFGSCNKEDQDQVMWRYVLQNRPHLWIWLGDIIYADTEDMAVMGEKYNQLKLSPEYQRFLADVPVIGIWDDHDYGANNAGKEYPAKVDSKQLLLKFLDEPLKSKRRKHNGAYTSYTYGPVNKQVKVILLDARYFRDPLKIENGNIVPDPEAKVLGEEQWKWLEQELTESSASVTLIGSGIQIIPEEHNFEKWANFPQERERLFRLIAHTKAKGVILLSGDRHIAEISGYQAEYLNYPLYEVTSSGLTHTWSEIQEEPNKYRIGDIVFNKNFGLIRINWSKNPLEVSLEIKGMGNETYLSKKILLQYNRQK